MARTHKDLEVWQKAIIFVTEIYKITEAFPKSEIYGLTSQIRRASVSIPSNIAEGASRNHVKEFTQFLYVALGSTSEIETQLIIATNLNYIEIKTQEELLTKLNSIARMIQGLIKSLKNK